MGGNEMWSNSHKLLIACALTYLNAGLIALKESAPTHATITCDD